MSLSINPCSSNNYKTNNRTSNLSFQMQLNLKQAAYIGKNFDDLVVLTLKKGAKPDSRFSIFPNFSKVIPSDPEGVFYAIENKKRGPLSMTEHIPIWQKHLDESLEIHTRPDVPDEFYIDVFKKVGLLGK